MAEPARITTTFIPRKVQDELYRKLKRFNVLICHRRFGKTVFAINEMIDRGLTFNKLDPVTKRPLPNPRFAYLAPLYGQAKRVAWDYLKMYTANIPGVITNEADLRVDIPRPHLGDVVRFTLLGADNPVSLKGVYLDGVILDEYGDMNPMAWSEVIRPTLSDRKGWALFIGTVKGMNHFWEMYEYARDTKDPEWFAAMYKASETGLIDAAELLSAKLQMSEEEYNQEFECDPRAGLVGAYFVKELSRADKEKRICNVPYDSSVLVNTYWDLGMNDTTVVWFIQTTRTEHRAIDYYEVSGSSITDTMNNVVNRGYNLDYFVLPHDAEVRELSTGVSRKQFILDFLRKKGMHPRVKVVPRVGSKMESINAARVILSKCYFDQEKCKPGLKSLSNYMRKWDAKNNTFQDSPLHNWASNGADGFQTFAMGAQTDSHRGGLINGSRNNRSETDMYAECDYDPFGRSA